MSQIPVIAAIAALLVSTCSLAVAILAYRRDMSELRAWSTIHWHQVGTEMETPVLHVRIANKGRRPILVLNLVIRAGRAQWSRYLNEPTMEMPSVRDGQTLIKEIERRHVAQAVAVKLAEGEVFELAFQPEDCRDEFIGTHWEPPAIAERLLVEDVTGRCYPVRGSKRHLKQLLSAAKWK